MLICILDGNKIENKEQLHKSLAHALNFPNWYGENLDALYDCLTDLHERVEIQILNMDALKKNIGNYIQAFIKVLTEASKQNTYIEWRIVME